MKTKYGLPLVNADNIMETLNCLGIKKWKKISESVYSNDYFLNNTDNQEKNELPLPQIKATVFLNPDDCIFNGFRFMDTRGIKEMHGVRVFTMLDEYLVPVCGEFQHGCEEILIDLPGGRLEPNEIPAACAKREFEEESGIILKKIIYLGTKANKSTGMPIAARVFGARNFSFMGIIDNPPTVNGQNLDKNEYLKTVLISLEDWLKLIERELVQCYSASATLLALRKLGKI